jgi:CRP/FNR family cyclic AMP-dependent transcriptional regulator
VTTTSGGAALRAALEQTLLFGALDEAALDRLSRAARAQDYPRGATVVSEGDPGGDMFVVVAGRVKICTQSPNGDELIHRVAAAGDTFGEISVFDPGPRSATVEALEPSTVVRLPGAAVRTELRAAPDLAEELLRQLAGIIRRLNGTAADLVFLDLPRRLGKWLLEHADRGGTVDLGLSQSQLAAAVGGVRQSVNAALRGFERRGWLQVQGRTVVLADREALTAFTTRD